MVPLGGPRALSSAPAPDVPQGSNTYRDERSDLLSILDELDTDTLADGGVGLLGLNANLLQHDTLCVGGASSRGGLVDVAEGALLVRLIRLHSAKKTSTLSNLQLERNGERVGVGEYRLNTHPAIFTAIVAQLARGLQSTGFVG